MNKGIFCGLLLAAFGVSDAPATETVSIEPGHWDMNIRIEMPRLPEPQQRTFSECIEQSELNPEDFDLGENSPCRIGEVMHSGQTVSWSVTCPGRDGDSYGEWSFVSRGDTLEGSGSMVMELNGESLEFSMVWTGARTGECED